MNDFDTVKDSEVSAEKRFKAMDTDIAEYIRRGELSAELSNSALFSQDPNKKVTNPGHGIGAECIDQLSGKINDTLFPLNENCISFRISNKKVKGEPKIKEMRHEINKALAYLANITHSEMEIYNDREKFANATQLLIVTGNALVVNDEDEGLRVYNMYRYRVKRDLNRNPIEIVFKDIVTLDSIDDDLYEEVYDILGELDERDDNGDSKDIEIYTRYYIDGTGKKREWKCYSEVKGKIIESSRNSFPLNAPNIYPIAINMQDGEHYGHGVVEKYFGDFQALSMLSTACTKGMYHASFIRYVISPTSFTSPEKFRSVPFGGAFSGSPEDIKVISMDKLQNFSFIMEYMKNITDRLYKNFYVLVTRDAERVTTVEIENDKQKMAKTLSGLYSSISSQFQVKFIRHRLNILRSAGVFEEVDKKIFDMIEPQVVGGINGLGQESELIKFTRFMDISQKYGVVDGGLKKEKLAETLAILCGIDTTRYDIIRTEEDIQAENEQKHAMEMEKQAVAPGIGAMGNAVTKGMDMMKDPAVMQQILGGGEQGPPQM